MSTQKENIDRFPAYYPDPQSELSNFRFPEIHMDPRNRWQGGRVREMLWNDLEAYYQSPNGERGLEIAGVFGPPENYNGILYVLCKPESMACNIAFVGEYTTNGMIAVLSDRYPELFPPEDCEYPGRYMTEIIDEKAIRFTFPPGLFGNETPFVLDDILKAAQADMPDDIERITAEMVLRNLEPV